MFGRNKKKLESLGSQIRLLQNANTWVLSELSELSKRITILENPAKYSIGFEIKDKYLITGRKWDKTNYAIASSTGMYHCMEGWRYDVFDKEGNKPTTFWEDQITKLIEDGKK